ncbi:MAG: flagellin, partial [Psychromonas sp.]|nr:flagellin [Psychromonas sp.]
NNTGIQGVVASTNEDTGKLVLTSQSGSDITVATKGADVFDADTSSGLTTRGAITLIGEEGVDVTINSTASSQAAQEAAFDKLGLTDMGGNSGAVGKGLSVNTAENANNSIDRIDDALNKISDSRANLGAIQNRLGSTISNLENVSQNLSAAKSRIYDADFAAETSKMSKAQILQQAGTSMLSQANASSQNVMSLLQG